MNQPARTFQDLFVWKKAHLYVLTVYRVTAEFPKAELYGLTSQFRRAAVSIAANIAEGFKKRGKADKIRFMNIAQGSLEETRYYILLASDLAYANMTSASELSEEVSKLLDAYTSAITNSID